MHVSRQPPFTSKLLPSNFVSVGLSGGAHSVIRRDRAGHRARRVVDSKSNNPKSRAGNSSQIVLQHAPSRRSVLSPGLAATLPAAKGARMSPMPTGWRSLLPVAFATDPGSSVPSGWSQPYTLNPKPQTPNPKP